MDDGGDGGIDDDCTIVDDTNVSDGTGVDEWEKKRNKTVAMITEEEWSHRQRVHPHIRRVWSRLPRCVRSTLPEHREHRRRTTMLCVDVM